MDTAREQKRESQENQHGVLVEGNNFGKNASGKQTHNIQDSTQAYKGNKNESLHGNQNTQHNQENPQTKMSKEGKVGTDNDYMDVDKAKPSAIPSEEVIIVESQSKGKVEVIAIRDDSDDSMDGMQGQTETPYSKVV